MKIQIIKPYLSNAPGDIIDPNPPVAELLIQRGIAQRISEVREAVSPGPGRARKTVKRGSNKRGH